MRVLAVDTSTLAGGVALLEDERIVGEYLLDVRTTHSERLLAGVDRLMADAGWSPEALDGLAVAVGPGSFTGLRIGLSAVKGLAFALAIPIAAVPTLDALAAALPHADRPICPVLTARKGEVYASLYRWHGGGARREWEYLALSPAGLAARFTERVILVGDGASSVHSPLAELAPPPSRRPSPAWVGHLGLDMLRAGATVAPADLVPLYLRPFGAELERRGVAVR
jgi:tRNA threonylcarbamoyladenosine biosynthesis protein TsaB